MALTQLNPQIPLMTERGNGQAIAVIDYSEEHDLMWVVILDETGEIWAVPNPKVRGFPNYTSGRKQFKNPFEKGKKKNSKTGGMLSDGSGKVALKAFAYGVKEAKKGKKK